MTNAFVIYGSGWSHHPGYCRVEYRYWNYPYIRFSYIGFRLTKKVKS